jgi:hypothetical protein
LLHTSHIDAEHIEREVITDQMAVEHRFLWFTHGADQ